MKLVQGLIAVTVAINAAFYASAQECDTGTANTDALMMEPPANWDPKLLAGMSPDNVQALNLHIAGYYADSLKQEATNIFDAIADAATNGREIDAMWYTRDGGYSPVFEPVLAKIEGEIATKGADTAIAEGRKEATKAIDAHVVEQIQRVNDLNDPSICSPGAPKEAPPASTRPTPGTNL